MTSLWTRFKLWRARRRVMRWGSLTGLDESLAKLLEDNGRPDLALDVRTVMHLEAKL